MNIKNLIIASAVVVMASYSDAACFDWSPVVTQPNPTLDVTQVFQIERISLNCYGVEGVGMTDVLPRWIDEDGNEIAAKSGEHDPWGWDATQFEYYFDIADFKTNGEYILLFPEGMLVDGAGDLSAKKEIPYTFDVPELAGSMFDDFEVLSLSPDLSQPQAIWDQQQIVIATNHNDAIGLVMLTVKDITSGEVITVTSNFATGRGLGDSSDIVWTVGGIHKFYEDHTYQAEFVFYNGKDSHGPMGEVTPIVDKAVYEFLGKVEGYKFSSVTLVSVSPEPESILISEPSQAVFKYVFSGPVDVYKAETPLGQNGKNVYPQSCLSSDSEKTEWTLDLSSSNFVKAQDAMLTINVYARDMDGYQVMGNRGEESESCFQYSWNCELGATPIVLVSPAEGESVGSLKSVVVKALNGDPMSWSWTGVAEVCSADGGLLGTLVYELPENSRDNAFKEITFDKWINAEGVMEPILIEDKGSYSVSFSHGCFVFGEQYDSSISHSLVSSFEVTGDVRVAEVADSSSEGDVFDMQGRLILRNASQSDLKSLAKGIYIVGGRKIVIK